MSDGNGDWSGDWVFSEIAACVDRAGPRPVSESHKPGLVPRDVDWLINELSKINVKSRPASAVVRHAREIMARLIADRAREAGSVNLVGNIRDGFTTSKRSTKSEGPATELKRLRRAALAAAGSPTRWLKAWASASQEVRRMVWRPAWGPIVPHDLDLRADVTGPRKVGFTRTKPKNLGVEGGALIGPKPEDVLPEIERALRDLAKVPTKGRQGNKQNAEADDLAGSIRDAVRDLAGRVTITTDRIAGKYAGPLADFGTAFDQRFGTKIGWRLIQRNNGYSPG